MPLNAYSSFSSTDSLTMSVYDSSNNIVTSVSCVSAKCAQDLDVSSWVDGRYEVQVFAMNDRGEKLGSSEKHFFYIANKAPELSLSFKGARSANLSKPLRGRVQIEISANSSSVPMSSIDFYRRGPDGKVEMKSAPIVPAKTLMGWRTNLIPNGNYEIWYVGHLKTNGMDLTVESPHQTVMVKN